MIDWIEQYIKRENENKKIISSEEYIKWIKKISSKKYRFSDSDYEYFSEKLDDFDRENLDLLMCFFEEIDKYAHGKGIHPTMNDSNNLTGEYYNVKFKDFCFKIGICTNQESYSFCEKSIFNKENKYIDFKEVIESEKKAKTLTKKL